MPVRIGVGVGVVACTVVDTRVKNARTDFEVAYYRYSYDYDGGVVQVVQTKC